MSAIQSSPSRLTTRPAVVSAEAITAWEAYARISFPPSLTMSALLEGCTVIAVALLGSWLGSLVPGMLP